MCTDAWQHVSVYLQLFWEVEFSPVLWPDVRPHDLFKSSEDSMIDAAQPLCLMNGYTMLAIRGQKLVSTAPKKDKKMCVNFLCCSRLTLPSCCERWFLSKMLIKNKESLHWVSVVLHYLHYFFKLDEENKIESSAISHSETKLDDLRSIQRQYAD